MVRRRVASLERSLACAKAFADERRGAGEDVVNIEHDIARYARAVDAFCPLAAR
jgi:hypothetical protein